MSAQVTLEYNDGGQWRDILAVSSKDDNNNMTVWWVDEGGQLHQTKTQRGEGSGEFRDKN